jgi:nucleotide-binding universal stress UspA family protein
MFDNIIVGVGDPQAGRDALALAARLAAAHAQLTLAHVEVVPREPWPPSGAVTEATHASRALERLAELREAARVEARPVFVEARSTAAGLHELAARHAADLLIVGASRRDELEWGFAGETTRAVLDGAPCAIAVAPAGYAARPWPLERIGVAYNGSPQSERALNLARRLARERGAELSAFEAVPEPAYTHSIVYPQPEIDAGLEQARSRIAALGDVEPHAASGDDAAEALARYGTTVDLLVVGSHRHRPLDRLLSGGTAQRLAGIAPCSLLVLPHGSP